jgi:hypothetical protein
MLLPLLLALLLPLRVMVLVLVVVVVKSRALGVIEPVICNHHHTNVTASASNRFRVVKATMFVCFCFVSFICWIRLILFHLFVVLWIRYPAGPHTAW